MKLKIKKIRRDAAKRAAFAMREHKGNTSYIKNKEILRMVR